jgi:hypothetical protein
VNPGGPRRRPTAADWNPLLGLGEDIEDRLAQLGQRCVLGLFEGIEVPVDFLGGHGPIVLVYQPRHQGALTATGCWLSC